MSSIIPKNNLIDDLHIQKFIASDKMCQLMSTVQNHGKQKMIKTASIDNNALINLFANMLNCLNMKASEEDVKILVNKIAVDSSDLNKQAAIKREGKERKEEVKIASKNIKDSHYQIDVSKDFVQKNGSKMIMVSCYARDAYLGRYLIKRNYFYTSDREKFADNAYDEILTKVGEIKDRYYNEVIDVAGVFAQIKKTLDGVISEIQMAEDNVGTNVAR